MIPLYSRPLFAALIIIAIIALSISGAQAQNATTSEADLEDALWSCLHDRSPGVERDLAEPSRAFNPRTGQNFFYDKDKKAWIDAKTGKSICPTADLEGDLFLCLKYRSPGVERDLAEPSRAFNPRTGQNFFYDKDKKAWRDSKTGECICPKCPPQTVAAPSTAPPPPPPLPPPPEKKAAAPGGVKVASTSFYLGGFGGFGGIGPTHGLNLTSNEPDPTITSFRVPAKLATAATAGVSLGTWFNYPWAQLPPWASYFGFALGYTHYAQQYPAEGGTYSQTSFFPGGASTATGNSTFRSSGAVDSLGFMFKGRYGWLPDDQVPFGRLQTWAGVGPALYFVSQRPTVRFNSITSVNGTATFVSLNGYQKFSSASDTVVGLQVGVGASYYFFRWLSADSFLQYDHFTPSFSLTGRGGVTGRVDLPVDHFSINFGMSLHF